MYLADLNIFLKMEIRFDGKEILDVSDSRPRIVFYKMINSLTEASLAKLGVLVTRWDNDGLCGTLGMLPRMCM